MYLSLFVYAYPFKITYTRHSVFISIYKDFDKKKKKNQYIIIYPYFV